MYCTQCGKENADGAAFCTGCGIALKAIENAQSAVQRPIKKKNAAAIALAALSIVLAVALALSLTGVLGSAGGTGSASMSFSTPEDAINYFAGCLEQGDYEGCLKACAIGEMAKGYDYKAFAERIMSLQAIQMSYLPSEYEQYAAYNASKFEQQILIQMACFTVSLNLPEEYKGLVDGVMMPLEGGKFPDELIGLLDPANIRGLKIVKIEKAAVHDDERNRENQKKQAAIYGADDVQFRTVLYELNGEYYAGGFTLIEYGGRWLIQNMSDPLAGISAYGMPIKLSGKPDFGNITG